jgi:hypothetical protein
MMLILVENEILCETLSRGTSYETFKWDLKYSISVDVPE